MDQTQRIFIDGEIAGLLSFDGVSALLTSNLSSLQKASFCFSFTGRSSEIKQTAQEGKEGKERQEGKGGKEGEERKAGNES